jgi:hypothetical protein
MNNEAEIRQLRMDSIKVVRALDASVQLIEALIAWLPEGLVLSEQVKNAKGAWTEAMRDIRR